MKKLSFPGPTRNPSQRRNPDEARKPEGIRRPHGLKMTWEILWEIKSDFCMGNQGDYVEKIKGEFQGIVQQEKAQNKSRFVPKFPQDMLAEIRE